jgi:hypothetical protein
MNNKIVPCRDNTKNNIPIKYEESSYSKKLKMKGNENRTILGKNKPAATKDMNLMNCSLIAKFVIVKIIFIPSLNGLSF